MIQIAVCDNTKSDADLLIDHMRIYANHSGIEIQIHYYSALIELVNKVVKEETKYDMIFMEIISDTINGIEAARQIRLYDTDIPLIYVTSTKDYAVESYEVGAYGYILKPVDMHKLSIYMDKYIGKASGKLLVLRERGGGIRIVSHKDIMYLESYGHSINIHLVNDTILLLGKLSDYEQQLNDERFLRCHQSYLVNMDHIKSVDKNFILEDDTPIPIRVREKRKISEQYYKYYLNKTDDFAK